MIAKAIFNIFFWVAFLSLLNYHIHNNSWVTSISLVILITINLVENVIGFKKIIDPIKVLKIGEKRT